MSPLSPATAADDVSHAKCSPNEERNDEMLGEIKALMKARRERADQRLREWGKQREQIGFPPISITAKIKLERDGAAHHAVPILGEGELNAVERQCERLARVLQVERFVRMMPTEWIVVVVGVYVEQRSQTALALELQVDRNRVVSRLQDIQDRIVREIEAQSIAAVLGLTGLHATAV